MKLSAEAKQQNEQDNESVAKYVNDFLPMFSNEKLIEIAKAETKKMNEYYNEIGVKSPKEMDGEQIEKFYKDSIDYIKSNFFHSLSNKSWCVLSKSKTGSFRPLEYTSETLADTFINYFPPVLKKYFKNDFCAKYIFVCDTAQPMTFKCNDMNYFNMFNGYKFNKYMAKDTAKCDKHKDNINFVWNHILNLLCSNDEPSFKLFQHCIRKCVSGFKPVIMPYIKGAQGIGKSSVAQLVSNLIGNWNAEIVTNSNVFTGQFNGNLMSKSFVVLNEIMNDYSDFKSLYNCIKPYVTDDTISYRKLFSNPQSMTNISFMMMTGNHDMCSIEGDDRRMLIVNVSKTLESKEYYDKLHALIDNEQFLYAMFWDCIENYDNTLNEGHEIRKIKMNDTKQALLINSMDTITSFLKSVSLNETVVSEYIKPNDLYEFYSDFCKKYNYKNFLKSNAFKMKVDEYECIKIEKKRLDGTPTNYYKVDKTALYDLLKSKGYINEKYDTVEQVDDNNDLEYGIPNEDNEKDKIIQTQQNKIDELMKQIEELKAQMNNNKDKQIDDEIDNHSINLDISDIEEPEPEPPKKKVIKVVKKVVKKKVSNDEFVLVV